MFLEEIKNIKKSYSLHAVFLCIVVLLLVTFNLGKWKNAENFQVQRLIEWDITDYYSYLPAAIIHKDLSLKFIEKNKEGYANRMQFWPKVAENGGYVIKMTMGMSVLYSPFFIIAHTYASNTDNYSANGFSKPYEFMLVVSCIFYFVAGLMFLRKFLLRYFSEATVAVCILLIYFATNLFYYTTHYPCYSHAYTFSLFSVYLYSIDSWFKNFSWKHLIIGSFAVALMALIRPINVMFYLFPILIISFNVSLRQRVFSNKLLLKQIALCLLIGTLISFPQLMYWKYVTGNWLYYSYGSNETFYFSDSKILEGLLSYRKGWLLYTPIMIFSLVGFYFLKDKMRLFLLPIAVILLFYIYVVYSWWCWWYGGSFGARAMIDIYPLLAIPLAALIERIISLNRLKYFAIVMGYGFIVLNQVQTHQAKQNIIHWDGMTKEAYWYNFGKTYAIPGVWELMKRPDYEKAEKNIKEYDFDFGLPNFKQLEEHKNQFK